jgi:dTDP-glucose pyrophosphorylase
MIYYPIQSPVDAGIRGILIVTGGRISADFLSLSTNGKQWRLNHINYTYQEGEFGIADALHGSEITSTVHKSRRLRAHGSSGDRCHVNRGQPSRG